jgi:beta-glucosidase
MKEKMTIQQLLEENILGFWLRRMPDHEHGGFYGRIDGDNILHPLEGKGAVLNARILWTFAAAYRVLKKPEYLIAAKRAMTYICKRFVDKEYGGVFWELTPEGEPLNDKKQLYAQAFTLYAFAEYNRATGDEKALTMAKKFFDLIETCSDAESGGFPEAFTRRWRPLNDVRLSDKDANEKKSMNTHLHLLEAYTNLLRVWRGPKTCAALRRIIHIITEHIVQPSGHLHLFFDEDWNVKSTAISYGHEIEAAWLLYEAASVLGDAALLKRITPLVLRIAAAASEGLQPDGSLIYERNGNRLDCERHWWVQAEAVVGFSYAHQLSGAETYQTAACNALRYIAQNLVDFDHGEWYWSRLSDGSINHRDDKAGLWKCPYHNSRMCLELIEHFEHKPIHQYAMKHIVVTACAASLALATQAQQQVEQRAAATVAQMTLAEKVGQMAQISIDMVCKGEDTPPTGSTLELDEAKLRDAVLTYHVGSILNAPSTRARTPVWWNKTITRIQEIAMQDARLKIPVLYGLDEIHGATYVAGSTIFPQEIALAATWEPAHAKRMGEVAAYETRAANVPWNFAPVMDLGIDPRWARHYEGFGEDPYLASTFGYQLVKGYEGDNVGDPHRVAACMKHYIGYSAPISGKDRTPAYIPTNVLLEYHVPAFQAAVDAGVHSVMVNSASINGEPAHASHYLLTTLLREQMGFKGMVVTDWEDINAMHKRERMFPSVKEAIKASINAGVDMSMIPYGYVEFCTLLTELVSEGQVPLSRIDEAVTRIITLKLQLGLFDTPSTFASNYPEFHSKDFQQASYNAAAEGITLLKNRDILPLKKGAKILVTGPNAVSKRALCGGWTFSWQGEKIDEFADSMHTLLDAIRLAYGAKNVTYIPGVSYTNETKYATEHKDKFDEAIAAAKKADYVILCLGENSYCEKPGDLHDLYLNDLQTQLAQQVAELDKKTIVVLSEGRPRVISKFSGLVDAIVHTYLPGFYGADALADVLTGKVNPSGKLPYTYPAFPNSLVPYYHKHSEEQKPSAGAYSYEGDFNPEYHFGFGLSYTTFEYANLKLSKSALPLGATDQITISVDVTNTGKVAGKEVVQLYSSDLYASLIPDVKRLRRYKKVELKPNETTTVSFTLALNDLSFVNLQNERVVERGEFELSLGASSGDIRAKAKFTVE